MTTTPSGFGLTHSVNLWSRRLGVTLRPWSGTSPARLLVTGVVRLALCGLLAWLAVRVATDRGLAELGDELAQSGNTPPLGILAIILGVAAALVGLFALFRLAGGVIDLLGSREVSGVVVSLDSRRALDAIPTQLLRAVLARGRDRYGGSDTYRHRTELVVDTGSGVHQWTIRKHSVIRDVRRGMAIRFRVTPIAGYVSNVEILTS